MEGDARCRLQGADVCLLALGLGWVSRAAGYEGGKVTYAAYVVLWKQEPRQLPDIQPSVRSAPQGAVVEIEAVDIDIGTDEEQSPRKS